MPKKVAWIAVLIILTLVFWIHWSSNVQFRNTVHVLSLHRDFTKGTIIQPLNNTCSQEPFILILVTSYVGHVELRSAHRRAMPSELLKSFNTKRVFLLAKIPKREKYITQEAIKDESDTFGDIIQGSFLEHYRNLTYKHLMGLEWASNHCADASFILKVDDDIVFNLNKTYELLTTKSDLQEAFLLGFMLNNTKPRRNKENKWYVSKDEYPQHVYPQYLSGWYYITTPKTAKLICQEAVYHPYFWIDDIFITGILIEALGIKLMQLPKKFWLEYYELLECCLKNMIEKEIKCEYVVGPNGGRNNLIVEFNEAVSHCNIESKCRDRSDNEKLNKACVAYRERSIFSEGQAEVQNINY